VQPKLKDRIVKIGKMSFRYSLLTTAKFTRLGHMGWRLPLDPLTASTVRVMTAGYPTIDAVLTTLSQLYRPEIRSLMSRRDATLRARAAKGPGTLDDTRVEVLSEVSLDIDQRIANALTDGV
jgi:hypothetical protein